jgi:C1A family cysteine protease
MRNSWVGLVIVGMVWLLLSANHVFGGMYVHPDMQRAIQSNEDKLEKGEDLSKDFVMVDGQKRWTGFHPTSHFYLGASSLNFKVDPAVQLPKHFDIRDFSHSPVRGQIQGSCWAEGNVSAFELTWNMINQLKEVFAVNDVIDCSGFGSARNGGQLSMEYNVNAGLALESDYKYTGKDAQCREQVDRHRPLKAAPFLRGGDGKFPTELELMGASYQYGAFEVCGSASALGQGGRQDTPRNGMTNHCYAYAGWLDGEEMGWTKGVYHIIKNSWGDGTSSALNLSRGDWGDKGYGYYKLTRDGVRLLGSVITEIQVADTGEVLRAEKPVEFKMTGPSSFTVKIPARSKYRADNVKAALIRGGYTEVK